MKSILDKVRDSKRIQRLSLWLIEPKPESNSDKNLVDETPSGKPNNPSSLLRPIGWFLGGMSFFNLIHDISNFKLYGQLKEWVATYNNIVYGFFDFFFGWIDLWWLGISNVESHILIILLLVINTGLRVMRLELKRQLANANDPPAKKIYAVLFFSVFIPAWICLPHLAYALLLPTFAYAPLGIYHIYRFSKRFYRTGHSDDPISVGPKAFRREFIGVSAVFLILAAINFSLFVTSVQA